MCIESDTAFDLSIFLEYASSISNNSIPIILNYTELSEPFNPVTSLQYDLPKRSTVNISIYDISGRKVKTLVNHSEPPGFKSGIWDATDTYGKPVSAGIYLYQIQAERYSKAKDAVIKVGLFYLHTFF